MLNSGKTEQYHALASLLPSTCSRLQRSRLTHLQAEQRMRLTPTWPQGSTADLLLNGLLRLLPLLWRLRQHSRATCLDHILRRPRASEAIIYNELENWRRHAGRVWNGKHRHTCAATMHARYGAAQASNCGMICGTPFATTTSNSSGKSRLAQQLLVAQEAPHIRALHASPEQPVMCVPNSRRPSLRASSCRLQVVLPGYEAAASRR